VALHQRLLPHRTCVSTTGSQASQPARSEISPMSTAPHIHDDLR
jgi:hypothetical protein